MTKLLFETQRLAVRPFQSSDAEALFPILSDPQVMEYLEPPFSREKALSFLREAGLCRPPLVWAVTERGSGALAGHLIWHPFQGADYELGWVLGRAYWGRGYAGELTGAAIQLARRQGIPALVVECDRGQLATRRIAEKYGFAPAGQEGELLRFRLVLPPL